MTLNWGNFAPRGFFLLPQGVVCPGIWWVEARDFTKHPTGHGVPHHKALFFFLTQTEKENVVWFQVFQASLSGSQLPAVLPPQSLTCCSPVGVLCQAGRQAGAGGGLTDSH